MKPTPELCIQIVISIAFLMSTVLPSLARTNQVDTSSYYVDSVAGNDSNPGTITAPFKTLSMVTNATGKTIYGKAESVFHEPFPLPDNSHVMAYGIGTKPIVTGAEYLTNSLFTLCCGLTNTYEYPWTNRAMMVWETKGSGNFSSRLPGGYGWSITNKSIVEGIAGAWYWDTNNLYVHLGDNSNPASNTWVYEVAVRTFGIYSGSNTLCEDWIAEKQWVDAFTQGYNILGHCKNTYNRCIGRYAFYHNIGVTDSANQYMNLNDCVGFECEPWATLPTQIVWYCAAGPSVSTATRCWSIQTVARTNATGKIYGFYAHGSGNPTVVLNDCGMIDVAVPPIQFIGTNTSISGSNCVWELNQGGLNLRANLINSMVSGGMHGATNTFHDSVFFGSLLEQAYGTTVVSNCLFDARSPHVFNGAMMAYNPDAGIYSYSNHFQNGWVGLRGVILGAYGDTFYNCDVVYNGTYTNTYSANLMEIPQPLFTIETDTYHPNQIDVRFGVDGTNLLVILENSGGTLTTNKVLMSPYP